MQAPGDPAYQQHDHKRCIKQALSDAQNLCKQQHANLTPIRRQVLELIWQSHRPLGAYELMAQLQQDTGKQVAPPTVYRALEFLLSLGLVHRINSLNAFTGCCQPLHQHNAHFFICQRCQQASELDDQTLNRALDQAAKSAGFALQHSTVELTGLCPSCQQESENA